jgi:ribosomal protein S18 acetylase RimI-like enzyme
MKEKLCGDVRVCDIGVGELEGVLPDADYILAHTRYDNVEDIRRLKGKGFDFLNRTITARINLQAVKDNLGDNIRAYVQYDTEISDELYEIAYSAFPTDRRFHLGENFDDTLSRKMIKGYIDEAKKKNILVFKCHHKGKLVGFTLVEIINSDVCENILGAVLPEYQKRGVAINLYAYMRKVLAENGYKELVGKIDSTNVSSLNLHVSLGARFIDTVDVYCWRRGKTS